MFQCKNLPPKAPTPPAQRPRLAWPDASIGQVWLLACLALIWLFLSLTPLPPNDLWWHMAAGRVMATEGHLITENRWAFSLPADAPYVYQSWLSELALFWIWRLGDVPALALARLLAVCLSFGGVAWYAVRRSGSAPAAALALFAAALVSWNNWTLRPQTLALLPGAALVVLLAAYVDGRVRARWLAALPVIMVVWVNTHGSFVLGLALTGMAWLGVALGARRLLPALTLATIGSGASTLANPLGIGIVAYVRGMLSNPTLQGQFIEWQPPRISYDITSTDFWFFTLVLGIAVLCATGPRHPSAVDLLWYVALAWLGFSGVRYAMWFALAIIPLLADRLAALLPRRESASGIPALNSALLAALGLAMFVSLPWFAPARVIGNPRIFAATGPYRWLLSINTPVAASTWLAANPIAGRAWIEMSLSSYTMWAAPEERHLADLRVELFPAAVWADYFAIAADDAGSLAVITRLGITHLVLDAGSQKDLAAHLIATPGWCERYRDEIAVIVARCGR